MALSNRAKIGIGVGLGVGAIFLISRVAKADVDPDIQDQIDDAEDKEKAEDEKAADEAEERGEAPPPTPTRPPNLSGDSEGWNTEWFKNVAHVRRQFINQGYANDEFSSKPVIGLQFARNFQRDYNVVSRHAAAMGLIPYKFMGLGKTLSNMGTVDQDGTAGKNTLNALEIAHKLAVLKGRTWQNIVGEARGMD